MPSPFAFPPPPPPPPKASSASQSSQGQGRAPPTPTGHHANSGDQRPSRGRGQGHNSRGGRGHGTNQRGRGGGGGGPNQRRGSGSQGYRGGRVEHNGQSGFSSSARHNASGQNESNAPGSGQNENMGTATFGAYNQGLVNQAMPWFPEGINQFMSPQMQQYAAYTAAAQMMWNSQAFQASLSQAQANVASGWSNLNGQGYSPPSNESHSPPANYRHQGTTNRAGRSQKERHEPQRGQQSSRDRGQSNHKSQNKPHPTVAPAVPSFGFALPAPAAPTPPKKSTKQSNNKKRKLNQLGLTPQDDVQYSSEEELIDEEALWVDFKGPITIEHNGRICKLSSAADILAWKAERKREFPTSARIEQKRKDMAETRERLARLQRKVQTQKKYNGARDIGDQNTKPVVNPEEDAQKALEKQRQKVEYLRKRLLDSEKKYKLARLKVSPPAQSSEELAVQQPRARSSSMDQREPDQIPEIATGNCLIPTQVEAQDTVPQGVNLSLDYSTECSDDISADEVSPTDTSSVMSSSSDSSSSDESDSDEAPEIQSSCPTQPIRVEPPQRQPKLNQKPGLCAEYNKKGKCSRGKNCKWEHPPKPLVVKKRVTLLERFKTQEQKEGHRLALEAIKYLGNNGFLD